MPQFPNISRAIALLVLVYAIQAVIFIPLAALGPAAASAFMENPLTVAVFNTVSIGSVLLIGLRRTGAAFREVFPFKSIHLRLLLPMSLTVIGMSIILSEANNYLLKFLPIPPQIAKVFQDVFGAPEKFWGALLTAVIVAPLTEELLFRGLILRGFLHNYSVRKAIIASGLLFGAFHILPWQIPSAAVLGAIFAWWFVQTRSLLPCLFGHALNNGLTLIPLIIPQLKIPGYFNDSPDQVVFQPLWFNLLGVLLAGIGIWWLHREFMEMETERSRASAAVPSAAPAFSDNGRMENPQ